MERYIQISTYIVISPLILMSIIGNVLTLIVKLQRRKKKAFNSGDLFIVNLAICDLNKTWTTFMAWVYNVVIHDEWQFNSLSCSVLQKLVIILFSVSSLTLLVLTIERYFLIVKPFNRSFTFKRAKILLAVIWLVTICLNSTPYFLKFTASPYNDKLACQSAMNTDLQVGLTTVYYLIIVFIPCTVIMILSKVASNVLSINSNTDKFPKMRCCPVFTAKMRRNKSAIYILRSITLGYIFCYVPWAVIYIIGTKSRDWLEQGMTNTPLMPLVAWLIFGSFCNTPATYIIFSQEFRKEVRGLFGITTSKTRPSTRMTQLL